MDGNISMAEFQKMKLKVARVKTAVNHPNADKLIVLTIDTGGTDRQIVAGIRGHYAAEELVGRLIVVVENMEPAVIRGVKSEGMLLAARDGARVVLVTPEKEVNPGAGIS